MKLSRVCAIAVIGALMTVPVLAQSTYTSPSKTTNQPPPVPGVKPAPPDGFSGSTAPPASTGTGASTSKATKVIDINTASKEELRTLPGIGEARSDAIIQNRPYRSTDELVSKKVVPSNVYDGIKGQIAAVGGGKNTAAAGNTTKK